MSESVTQKTKKRNWTIVCYPESLPKDWKDILRESGLQVAISPLHDKDLNPDGTEKNGDEVWLGAAVSARPCWSHRVATREDHTPDPSQRLGGWCLVWCLRIPMLFSHLCGSGRRFSRSCGDSRDAGCRSCSACACGRDADAGGRARRPIGLLQEN